MKKSKELAFLNFLQYMEKKDKNPNSQHYNVNIRNLEKILSLNESQIIEFLTQLKDDLFLDFIKTEAGDLSINFKLEPQKFSNFVPSYKVDYIIKKIQYFVFKYISLFHFELGSSFSIDVAKKIGHFIENDPNYDISEILRVSLIKGKQIPEIKEYFARVLITLCDNIEDEDQYILEYIIYSFIVISFEDNPFVITLFLCRISIQLEAIKKDISWKNLLDPQNIK